MATQPSVVDEKVDVMHSEKVVDNDGSDYHAIAEGFLHRDAEWHAQQTKKLLWKVDLRLLPW